MRRSFFLLALCLLLASQVIAQNKDLVINADNVSYDKEHDQVQAAGSVEVIYRDVTIYGNYLVYNTKLDKIWADRGFILSYGDISIEGETLAYEIKEKKGRATDIMFDYQGMELTGKRIDLSEAVFQLKNASFTTCNISLPHYKVTASDITFYPKYGWLVAYWGYFWLGPVPVMPMPTYIFDMLASEKNRKNVPPFPEVGSNDEDGTFINERLAWHLKRELSGTYSLTYATKKGFGAGVEADYILSDSSRGNARLNGNGTDGLYGGLSHYLYFGEEIDTDQTGSFIFLNLPKHRRFELETTFAYHERINYQRVSFYPNLVLRSRQGKVLRDEANLDLELMAGFVSETGTGRISRGGGNFELSWDFPETEVGDLTPKVGFDDRYYSDGNHWAKTSGGLDFKKAFGNSVGLGLGYLHYFSITGTSPFQYELYRFSPADRLTTDLSFLVGETGVGVSTSYYLDTWQPEDIDYSLLFKMHCYDLTLKYRSIRNEFELGFSLAAGR